MSNKPYETISVPFIHWTKSICGSFIKLHMSLEVSGVWKEDIKTTIKANDFFHMSISGYYILLKLAEDLIISK